MINVCFLELAKCAFTFLDHVFYMACYPRMVRRFDCYYFVRYGFVCCLHNSFRNVFDILINVASLLCFFVDVAFRKFESAFSKSASL